MRIAIIFLGETVAIMALIVIGSAIFASHTVQQYYIGHPGSSSLRGYCVMASINWDRDDAVFCSDEISRVIEMAAQMNAALVKK